MVVRYYIKCDICSKSYTLRIGVGHNSWQEHSFTCSECLEEIHIGLDVDFSNFDTKLKCLNNCTVSYEEGMIINLHPEYSFPKEQLHTDLAFPWLKDVMTKFDLDKDKNNSLIDKEKRIYDGFVAIGGNHRINDEWNCLKKAWSLSLNNKTELSNKIINDFFKNIAVKKIPNLAEWQLGLAYRLISPGFLIIFEDANAFLKSTYSKYQGEFKSFLNYYGDNLKKSQFERYFEIFSEYFKNYSEYSQVLVYVKNNKEIPQNYFLSSNLFKNTKMFYGNAFEAYTSNLVILACINNIASGRKYDQFQQMDLKKYLTIDKANRANPFINTQELKPFSFCMDSTLRNASHHGSMKYLKGQIIYRSGGTGAEHKISYTDYIVKCNVIMLYVSTLFILDEILAR